MAVSTVAGEREAQRCGRRSTLSLQLDADAHPNHLPSPTTEEGGSISRGVTGATNSSLSLLSSQGNAAASSVAAQQPHVVVHGRRAGGGAPPQSLDSSSRGRRSAPPTTTTHSHYQLAPPPPPPLPTPSSDVNEWSYVAQSNQTPPSPPPPAPPAAEADETSASFVGNLPQLPPHHQLSANTTSNSASNSLLSQRGGAPQRGRGREGFSSSNSNAGSVASATTNAHHALPAGMIALSADAKEGTGATNLKRSEDLEGKGEGGEEAPNALLLHPNHAALARSSSPRPAQKALAPDRSVERFSYGQQHQQQQHQPLGAGLSSSYHHTLMVMGLTRVPSMLGFDTLVGGDAESSDSARGSSGSGGLPLVTNDHLIRGDDVPTPNRKLGIFRGILHQQQQQIQQQQQQQQRLERDLRAPSLSPVDSPFPDPINDKEGEEEGEDGEWDNNSTATAASEHAPPLTMVGIDGVIRRRSTKAPHPGAGTLPQRRNLRRDAIHATEEGGNCDGAPRQQKLAGEEHNNSGGNTCTADDAADDVALMSGSYRSATQNELYLAGAVAATHSAATAAAAVRPSPSAAAPAALSDGFVTGGGASAIAVVDGSQIAIPSTSGNSIYHPTLAKGMPNIFRPPQLAGLTPNSSHNRGRSIEEEKEKEEEGRSPPPPPPAPINANQTGPRRSELPVAAQQRDQQQHIHNHINPPSSSPPPPPLGAVAVAVATNSTVSSSGERGGRETLPLEQIIGGVRVAIPVPLLPRMPPPPQQRIPSRGGGVAGHQQSVSSSALRLGAATARCFVAAAAEGGERDSSLLSLTSRVRRYRPS